MADSSNPPKLYASREPIFPRRVKGHYRNLKWWIMGITLLIYYVTPWIRWDRGPELPNQAVLVDMAHRRFYFFFIEIWPHEFFFVAGLLIMAGLGLFLFTAALGRVWCGYTCPQTVWTDLFILVERWVEGDRNARVRLWNAPWDARKWRLRLTKWFIWLVIAVLTGGAWVFYFTDAPTLFGQLFSFSAPAIAYLTIGVLTLTTFLFGGFAREQVCIYMCPWPRIQAAMMDEDSLTVAYRDWRGEPRGKHRKAEGADKLGDCIDCNACVAVCPMGIDIRDGQQLACITCALCIDACDDVMTKIGKPRGLIDYLALTDETAERKGEAPRSPLRHIMRPRVLIYTFLWALIGVGLLVALFMRPDSEISVAPVRQPLFVTLSDGTIRNTYDIRVRNKSHGVGVYYISVNDPTVAVEIEGESENVVEVPIDKMAKFRVYISANPDSEFANAETKNIEFILTPTTSEDTTPITVETVFHGKGERN